MYSFIVQSLILLLTISATFQADNTVLCFQAAAILKCPSKSCSAIGYVRNEVSYPSDCFVIGKDPGFNSKYYRINLLDGGYGYSVATWIPQDEHLLATILHPQLKHFDKNLTDKTRAMQLLQNEIEKHANRNKLCSFSSTSNSSSCTPIILSLPACSSEQTTTETKKESPIFMFR
ncbi:unnamed protein product [Rotaria socialis]|uniref:Uncharacterized protein n=1 Tax=Rotaria socialis TaxID=392032 RepID=A0A821A1K7_9BILA|nr:unnamed protein product [Rotaria socialis]CAF4277730.1 unnamed protein product [Rotaria socialis]CAF4573670.1 unnamed protein product [Rotaria socialis]